MMDPSALEDTIHEMANSLTRLNVGTSSRGGSSESSTTPRSLTAPTSELRRVFTTTTPKDITSASVRPSSPPCFSAFRPAPLFSQYSPSPPSSPDSDAVIPWPALDGEPTYIRPSQEFLQRRPSTRCSMQHPGRRLSIASSKHTRSSSSVSAASYMLGTSPFPAPSKPLPPVPSSVRSSQSTSQRASSQPSWTDKSSVDMDRYSQSSGTASSNPSRSSFQSLRIRPPIPPRPPEHLRPEMPASTANHCPLELVYWKHLWGAEKRKAGKTNMVLYMDVSAPGATVATKHGNAIIKFWNVSTGQLKNTIKISAYTEAHSRGREYLIRSHTILSEANQLAAIATRFGRSVEIWSFADKPKKLQLIDDADRWVAGRFESFDSGWSALAAYRGKEALIDLYAATTRDKKPFAKVRTIDVRKAGLPFLPQYPELAISPTSHILAIAAGPRTPRAGHPPPDRETLLVTWDISDYRDVTNQPHRVVRPWQHRELETALPCTLVAYGDLIMSIWIPAGYRTVATKNASGNTEYTLSPTPVPFRYVLVWDLSENSTRTYGIPNTVSCISPDCRFVAYCNVAERRTKLAILDAQSGDELWTVGGEGNLKSLEQVGDLSKVTELAFSQDGRFLMVGDVEGNTSVYDVRASMI